VQSFSLREVFFYFRVIYFMKFTKSKFRIAIQKNGRLTAGSLIFLRRQGLKFQINKYQLVIQCQKQPVEIILVRDDDVAKLVEQGNCDLGIVGLNLVKESCAQVRIVRKLPFAYCRLDIAVPKQSTVNSFKKLSNKRIATSYVNILQDFLTKQKVRAQMLI